MGEGELLVGYGGRHPQVDYLHLHRLQGAEVPGKRGRRGVGGGKSTPQVMLFLFPACTPLSIGLNKDSNKQLMP